ncbi:MAG: hypothetical protein ACK4GJ_05975 [bacterium]
MCYFNEHSKLANKEIEISIDYVDAYAADRMRIKIKNLTKFFNDILSALWGVFEGKSFNFYRGVLYNELSDILSWPGIFFNKNLDEILAKVKIMKWN